jgi:hypothetical protein
MFVKESSGQTISNRRLIKSLSKEGKAFILKNIKD